MNLDRGGGLDEWKGGRLDGVGIKEWQRVWGGKRDTRCGLWEENLGVDGRFHTGWA